MEIITWKYFRLVPLDELSETTAKSFTLTLLCEEREKYNSKYVEAGNRLYFVFADGSFQYQWIDFSINALKIASLGLLRIITFAIMKC